MRAYHSDLGSSAITAYPDISRNGFDQGMHVRSHMHAGTFLCEDSSDNMWLVTVPVGGKVYIPEICPFAEAKLWIRPITQHHCQNKALSRMRLCSYFYIQNFALKHRASWKWPCKRLESHVV